MNAFDHLSDDLTVMMSDLDRHPDQDRVKRLMNSLTRAHEEACRVSQALRQDVVSGQGRPRPLAA